MTQTNRSSLFIVSCIALLTTSMTFGLRANMIGDLGTLFEIANEDMGLVLGTAFWGFTISMLIGGVICDKVGIKRLLMVAFICHLSGVVLTIMATGFWSLFFSTLLIGLANGFVEAGCNPLVASLYPDKKTEKLNQFHVWFPLGIVTGGLIAYFTNQIGWNWQIQLLFILAPAFVYGFGILKLKFPPTERVASGISYMEMLKSLSKPLFIVMVICMLLTAATELGTNQWIAELLKNAGISSILLLVFINLIMAGGRMFAGVFVHRLSSIGMLLFSAVFATIGLLLLSYMSGYMSFLAAAVFAIGICFFWPTMLGFVSEKLPETGSMGLSVMGAAGMLSVALILPFMGQMYDSNTQAFLENGILLSDLISKGEALSQIQIDTLNTARLKAGSYTLRLVAIMPAFLILVFGVLFFKIRRTGEHHTISRDKVEVGV